MSNELISIIVPVYNAEKYLDDTINSILYQTYSNWELIFIDDCSVDNSFNIIQGYMKNDDRIKYYKMDSNGGPAVARNKGIEKAIGTYICFQDADDLWDNDKLEKQIKYMKQNNYAFSYTSYEFTNAKGIPTGKRVIAKKKLEYKEALKNNIISTITVMFDMRLIEKNMIKMEDLKYVEDTATWWKILRHNYIAYGIPDLFSYYRRGDKTESSNKIKTQKRLWFVYRKQENLRFFTALNCLCKKNLNAVLRRI